MNLSISVQQYLDEISSNSPTPGGGSVSAFAGATACSLGIMVCNLTIGKKKYANVEQEIIKIRSILEDKKAVFLKLSEQDNQAFDKVMEAFKLPKETEEQKSLRGNEIDKATFNAALVPSKVLTLCKDTLLVIENLYLKGNQNCLSDAGVAVSLIETAAQGAFLNVLINCSSMPDNAEAKEMLSTSHNILNQVKRSAGAILTLITQSLYK